MWSGNQSQSEEGILLLEPKHKFPCNHLRLDAKSSCLGGPSTYYPNDLFRNNPNKFTSNPLLEHPICDLCNGPMHLILQLYAPLEENDLDRTMYVFGCNSASCLHQAFGSEENDMGESIVGKRFSVGGGGAIKCFRSQSARNTNVELEKCVNAKMKHKKVNDSGWGEAGHVDVDSIESSSDSSDDDSIGVSMDD